MSHITTAQLVELFCGDAPDEAALEAHVFECDLCGAAYARLGELCATLRTTIPPVISHAHRDRMIAEGSKVLETPVQAGVTIEATFATGLDLLVHQLRGDFTKASQVDLTVVGPNSAYVVKLEHVPFSATEVLIACQRHYQDRGDPTFVLTVTEGETTRKASYFVVHHFPA